jgi:hypothetical protein
VPADRALVRRILAETGVERTPAPPQASYLAELWRAFWRFVAERITHSRLLRLGPQTQLWIVGGLAVLAFAAVAWMLFALLRRGRSEPKKAKPAVSGAAPAAVAWDAWDAAAWRAELERCLAGERIGEALRAAWWWLARSIAGPEAEPDWTSRDLAARTERRELRDLLRRLDALTFGADRPGLPDLRHLAEQIRGALG